MLLLFALPHHFSPIAGNLALDLRRTSWIYELAAGITRIAAFELGFSTAVLSAELVFRFGVLKSDMQTLRRLREVNGSICRREELHRNPRLLLRVFGGGLVV